MEVKEMERRFQWRRRHLRSCKLIFFGSTQAETSDAKTCAIQSLSQSTIIFFQIVIKFNQPPPPPPPASPPLLLRRVETNPKENPVPLLFLSMTITIEILQQQQQQQQQNPVKRE